MVILWVSYGKPPTVIVRREYKARTDGVQRPFGSGIAVLNGADFDAGGSEFGGYAGRDGMVCNDAVDLRDIGNVNETALVEFGGIEDGDHFVCLLNHHLVEQRFLEVRRRDTVFDGEGVHAEEEFVAVEIPQDGKRERSDHRETVDADVSSEQHHIETLVCHEFVGDIHGVGEDAEVVEFVQVFGYLERSGAGIEHDEIAIFDEFDRFFSDTFFLFEVKHPLFGDGGIFVLVLHGFAHSSSAGTKKEVTVLKNSQILSNSNLRNTGCPAYFGN